MLLELAVAHCLASEAGVAGAPAAGGRPCALSFLAVRFFNPLLPCASPPCLCPPANRHLQTPRLLACSILQLA